MFIQQANPVSGMMEWVCCDEDDEDIKHEIARSDMLLFINFILFIFVYLFFMASKNCSFWYNT